MLTQDAIIYHGPSGAEPDDFVRRFAGENGHRLLVEPQAREVIALVNRSFPGCLVVDAAEGPNGALETCRLLKSDPFTAIVPVVVLAPPGTEEFAATALEAGADEILSPEATERERWLRLEALLRRADRDVSVHPTTRLPGTAQIERDLSERLARNEHFALCYADLDHFKEFNDRYGYNEGDRVIQLLSRILRDLVRAYSDGGFIGHIGGDDFIFTVPLEDMEECCEEIVSLFDELIPYQYTEEDRRAGYFLGKDRRGNVHRIPIMTLSIGIVTNQFQEFSHTAQVSELATEMKSYAKTLPGTVFVVDRRHPDPTPASEPAPAPGD